MPSRRSPSLSHWEALSVLSNSPSLPTSSRESPSVDENGIELLCDLWLWLLIGSKPSTPMYWSFNLPHTFQPRSRPVGHNYRYSPTDRNRCYFSLFSSLPARCTHLNFLKGLHFRPTDIYYSNLGLSVTPTTQAVCSAMTSAPSMALIPMQEIEIDR